MDIQHHTHNKRNWNNKWWVIGTAIIILTSILYKTIKPNIRPSEQSMRVSIMEATQELSSSQHLEEARRALDTGYRSGEEPTGYAWRKVYVARMHLEAIQHNSPEYLEAQRLLNEIRQLEAEMEKISAKLTQKMSIRQRREVVEKLVKYFCNKKMDVCVKLEGEDETIVILEYVQWSRPLVYKIVNGTGFLEGLKKKGFTKVVFDATHNYSWTYCLDDGN